jgi:hypothetical protein
MDETILYEKLLTWFLVKRMATKEEDTSRSSQLARLPRSGAHLEQTLFVSILIVFDLRSCFPKQ